MAAILAAIVHTVVGLALALRPGDAATAVTFMAALVAYVLLALWGGLVAVVGDVALLLLGPVVVVPRRHQEFSR